MLVFDCRFGVEVSRCTTVVSQTDANVKKEYVSGRVRTGKCNGGLNVVKIIDENFSVIRTFGTDHKNIDISQSSVGLE